MNKSKLIAKAKAILKGIDETQQYSEQGWWETSTGAEFGYNKLEDLIVAIADGNRVIDVWLAGIFSLLPFMFQRSKI